MELKGDIAGKELYCEVDNFYQPTIHNHHTGKELFQKAKLAWLFNSITGKSFLPEPA
jgi:hypothetical protein